MTLSDEEERGIRERHEKATPGPWYRSGRVLLGPHGESFGTIHDNICFDMEANDLAEPNADFIAHAPSDIQALLEELSRLREENKGLREAMEASLRGEK